MESDAVQFLPLRLAPQVGLWGIKEEEEEGGKEEEVSEATVCHTSMCVDECIGVRCNNPPDRVSQSVCRVVAFPLPLCDSHVDSLSLT